MRRRGKPRRRLLRLVLGSASQGGGEGGHDPPPHPLLSLALTHAVRLVERRSANILFFHQMGRTQPQGHTPKIDRGDGV